MAPFTMELDIGLVMHPIKIRAMNGASGLAAKHIRALFVAAVLLVTTYRSAHYLFFGNRNPWPIDFDVFWHAGGRPFDELYAASELPFVYPPTSLFLFKPLSLLPIVPSYFAWITVSTVLFGFAAARACGAKVSALSFLSPAANRGIMWGQSSMLLGGMLFASLRLPPLAMGATFGLVAVVKPQLVLLAPIAFLVRREWTTLGGMAAASIVAVIASLIAFGPALWMDWLRASSYVPDILERNSAAITPAGRAEFLGLPVLPVILVSFAVGLAAVLLLAKRLESENLIALIVAASLVSSPYAHTHDTIALIPACIVLLQKGSWPMAVCAAFVLGGAPAWIPVALLAGLIAAVLGCWQHAPRANNPVD